MQTGYGTGWVYRVGIPGGNTGVLPSQHALLGESAQTAERAPEAPLGAGVGGLGARANGDWGTGISPPCGPGRSPRSPPWDIPLETASWRHMARIDLILLKVSQNGEVSAKLSEKACHSPCFQKRARNSPLEIPRFPFCVAFSPKELMDHF